MNSIIDSEWLMMATSPAGGRFQQLDEQHHQRGGEQQVAEADRPVRRSRPWAWLNSGVASASVASVA